MRKHNVKNERIKRQYLAFLGEAKRLSPKSVDQAAAAIASFEASTGHKDFAHFHIEQARKFKRDVHDATNPATGKPLAKATIHSRLMALKAFAQWLAGQPGYKSRIRYSDAEYFNPSANDSRIATAHRERPVPSMEQIRHAIFSMRNGTGIEKRNRAIIAFGILSGARDDAIASLSLRHIDLTARTIFQDARTVRTKNRATLTSSFFPVGADIEDIVIDWISYLKTEMLFGPDDPLFPATRVGLNEAGHFAPIGLDRKFWKNADAIRRIYREAFEAVGLPYFNPHSFRKTLAQIGIEVTTTTEEWAAWSANFGHANVATTFQSYAKVPSHRRAEIFERLNKSATMDALSPDVPDQDTIARVVAFLQLKAG
ncbi:MAG: recombinase XerC [Ahrensia sp.]|nr:recombinase XerC [Ahrensia sp.]|tara:strand:- start:39552 stop:40661 length:1110 start_codon:yes stop_codon:yes gene_type:complete